MGHFSGISKPMVCVRVTFPENAGNHENEENDKDNSDSYKQRVECWICENHRNHENDENHGNPGCKPRVPQPTGLETPDFSESERVAWKTRTVHNKAASHKALTGSYELSLTMLFLGHEPRASATIFLKSRMVSRPPPA